MGHAEDLDRALLGEPVTLTRLDVVALSGVPLERAHAVWSALGLPALADEEVAFTVADVRALKTAVAMQESGAIDPDTLLVLARAMGQGLARLAEAQVDIFRTLSNGMTVEQATVATLASAVATLPQLEELVLFGWRRQFAAATARSFATARDCGQPVLAVDLVDFTDSTRSWSATELERTLERFERSTARCGARRSVAGSSRPSGTPCSWPPTTWRPRSRWRSPRSRRTRSTVRRGAPGHRPGRRCRGHRPGH